MLVQTISQYLGSHKRLVVPQLGTFIVKEPGVSIVFSELLKRDDGVLRGLLREAGVGELEAAGEIDRFVFEVRQAAQHGQEFRLDGFGVLRPGPNGTIAFAYEPRPVQSAADAAPGAASVPAGTRPAPAGQTPPKLPYSEPRVSPSAKMNPDPSVRGLRYGKPPKSEAEFLQRLEGQIGAVLELADQVWGYCYTQLTDVEQEQNGVYYYDRTPKFDTERIRAIFGRNPGDKALKKD